MRPTCPGGRPARRTSSSKPRTYVRTSVFPIRGPSRAQGLHDLEPALVEGERQVSRRVPRPPHLEDPDPALDVEVGDHVEPDLDDPVREEVLVPTPLEDLPADDPVGPLRDDEGSDPED